MHQPPSANCVASELLRHRIESEVPASKSSGEGDGTRKVNIMASEEKKMAMHLRTQEVGGRDVEQHGKYSEVGLPVVERVKTKTRKINVGRS